MLGLAEYVVQSQEVERLGRKYERLLTELQAQNLTQMQAYQAAKMLAEKYLMEYRSLLQSGLLEVARNAIHHYEKELGVQLEDDLADRIVRDVSGMQYYGATLDQRLGLQSLQLKRRLAQANLVGKMHQVFSGPTFGNQTASDRRLLLGMLSKIENEAAKAMAERTHVPLIKWSTSHRHKQPDICDDLASNVDQRVVEYLQRNNFKESPKGLYFAQELPNPPHPNCQCEYSLVIPNVRRTESLVKRAANAVRGILRRLWRK